jgi:hypothetical protein
MFHQKTPFSVVESLPPIVASVTVAAIAYQWPLLTELLPSSFLLSPRQAHVTTICLQNNTDILKKLSSSNCDIIAKNIYINYLWLHDLRLIALMRNYG